MSESLLVGNGTKLYRRNNSLVRSPIYKDLSLTADATAYYSVCGVYQNGIPSRGFISTTGSFVKQEVCLQGKMMRKSYLGRMTPTAGIQKWREAGGNVSRFIFYNGCYAPSGQNTFAAEAYMQIPAYHFTIPSKYDGATVEGVTLTLKHGGTIVDYGKAGNVVTSSTYRPYYAKNAPTSLLDSTSGWRSGWVHRFGVFGNLNQDAHTMYDSLSANEDVTLATDTVGPDFGYVESGTQKWRTGRAGPIFGTTGISYADDGIPISGVPWAQSFGLSQNCVSNFNSLRGGWIAGMPKVSVSTLTDTDNANDYPAYYDTNNISRWLCCSYWGFEVTVRLVIA